MKANKQAIQPKKKAPSKQVPKTAKEQGFLMKNKELLLLAMVVIITFIVYYPSIDHQFTNWDDPGYVTDNLYVKSLTPATLEYMFTKPMAVNYHPLTMLSLALNYKVSGTDPSSYFLVNIIFHLFNTLLTFYFAFLLLGRSKPLALFVAAIFALHPMHVESVAWISERKDVLYTFFFLSGLISWIKYIDKRHWSWYLFSLILFVLAGLSKPSSVVFPLILFLLDYFYKRKPRLLLVAEKLPFFAVAVGIGIATLYAQIGQAVADIDNYTIVQRFLFACYGFFIYIFKFFIPYGLSTLHPFPVLDKSLNLPWVYFIAPVISLAIIGFVLYSMKFTRVLFFCLMFYFINIALTLQFFQVGSAVIAERYTYVSYIGILIGVAFLIGYEADKRKIPMQYFYLLMVVYFGIMTILSIQRVAVWKNSETLWTDVIAKYPKSHTAYNSRGYYYLKEKMLEKALPDFTRSIEIRPTYLDALNNHGSVLRQLNQPRLAILDYNRALSIDPNFLMALTGRGNAYFTLGILDSALIDLNKAVGLNPGGANALGNRGAVFFRLGEYKRTIEDCSRAVAIDPYYTEAYLNRAVAYSTLMKWDLAISDYTNVINANTGNPAVYEWRGIAYRSSGAYQKAISDFNAGIQMSPSRSSLYINRAMAYHQAGMHDKAADDVSKARELGANVTEQMVFAGLK
jgi:tetratricopeptide (TPR) repeat protein